MNENSKIADEARATSSTLQSEAAPAGLGSRQQAAAAPAGVRPLRSLAVQVPLLLIIALSLVVSAGAWGLRTIVLRSFEKLEIAHAELDLRRFANGIDREVQLLADQLSYVLTLGSSVPPAGVFDIIPFAPAPAGYAVSNIACVFDSQGALISTDSHDPTGDLFQSVNPIDFCGSTEDHAVVSLTLAGAKVAGLHDASGASFIVAAIRLPGETQFAVPGGVLLLARHLSEEELSSLADRFEIDIDFWSMQTPSLDVLEAAAGAALSLGAPIIVNKSNEDVLHVYWAFQAATGQPAFLARANVFRDLREIGDETVLLSALAMSGVGLATILLSLFLVRSLMVSRLTRLTQHLLSIRRRGTRGTRLKLGRRDEIGVLAEEFDNLLSELSATTQRLADVSYRAGRAESTEGSLHNIGNALNSLLSSATAARARINAGSTAHLTSATGELAKCQNFTERQGKLAQYASLAAEEEARRIAALQVDIDRMLMHISRIEDILESQRRLGSDADLAIETEIADLVEKAVLTLPDDTVKHLAVRRDVSLIAQPPVICIRAITLQILGNLLINAVEAIEKGGRSDGLIEITAATCERDGQALVELCLRDNGVGLAADDLVNVFQRHYTTKAGRGHGIGLHWSASVVTSMHGQLYATSDGPGKGATMHLLLPAAGDRP